MLFSFSIIILSGLLANYLFEKIKIPGLIGMLFVGVLFGPHFLDFFDSKLLGISQELRMIAFIILLLRAGLSLNKLALAEVGRSAIPLGILPAIFEAVMVSVVSYFLFRLPVAESILLGIVLSAVSPAVVVKMMLGLLESKKNFQQKLPSLIITATALDNVLVITLFSACLGYSLGGSENIWFKFLGIPVSVILGAVVGVFAGFLLSQVFRTLKIRATKMMLVVLSICFLLTHLESQLGPLLPFSSILAVLSIGFILLEREEEIAHKISEKLAKLWIFAELILFILVGATVNVPVALKAGWLGLIVVLLGLFARGVGVYFALLPSSLSFEEKRFCLVSSVPKATVQALLGSIPLAYGISSGDFILAIAVVAIVFTAPLGAFLISHFGKKPYEEKS